jgi:phytanoyl-CoA hydroxylase
MNLDAAMAQYETDGYAIVRGVIDEDLILQARDHIEWLQQKYPDLRPEELHHPLIRNDAFWVRLVTDGRILDVAEAVLGPDIACFTAHYICKPPYDGRPVLWHQDGAYWKLDPMVAMTAWLAVDPSTPENGCLKIIPGSHHEPLRKHELRLDVPNMLSSETEAEVVDRWIAERGIVDIELAPGDLSIHHPQILHCSEANTSSNRRCGLDMGFMPATTRISNEGLYLNALLVRGQATEGVNQYRQWPEYQEGESIEFEGSGEWNRMVAELNARDGWISADHHDNPLLATQRMIDRLRAGTVKQ